MVFAKMLYDAGNIEEVNYQIYSKWFDCFACEYPIKKIIYVNSSPKICYDRIHERSRLGESVIPLEYLNKCHEYHTGMMQYFSEDNREVLELDGNVNLKIKENEHVLTKWLEDINVFIL